MKTITLEPFYNYYFLNYNSPRDLIAPTKRVPLILVGKSIRKAYPEGALITSANVAYKKSLSGKEYAYSEGYSLAFKRPLLNKHPDYIEFLNLKGINYPILTNWNLRLEGNSYILTGECEDFLIEGTVTSQYGNYVTLDGTDRVYVEWISISDEAKSLLKTTGVIAGLDKKDFDYYLYDQIRPNFNLSDHLV